MFCARVRRPQFDSSLPATFLRARLVRPSGSGWCRAARRPKLCRRSFYAQRCLQRDRPNLLSARGRLTSDEFTYAATTAFGTSGDFFANQADSRHIETFCKLSLDYKPDSFDGVLIWDCLEYLAPELLEEVVSHLFEIARPGASLLCYFHADQNATKVPITQFRIIDSKTIQTATRQLSRPTQFYSNRAVERIFQNFQSVKFFLTRDHLREVIVRR